MKKSGEDRLKQAINESTLSAAKKEANPASLRSAAPSKGRGSRGHFLLPMEGGAPKGRRLDGEAVFPYHSLSLRETGRGIHFSFTNFHLSMI